MTTHKKFPKIPSLRNLLKSPEIKNLPINKSVLRFTGSVKLHGCLPAKQKILMSDGTKKKIKNIKKGEYVKGYDGNHIVNTKVVNTFENKRTDKWLRFTKKLERYNNRSNVETFTVTDNHLILSENKYVEAKILSKGDSVDGMYKDYMFPPRIADSLIGLILGDGSLSKELPSGKRMISYSFKKDHKNLGDHFTNILGIFSSTFDESISGYGTKMIRWNSRTSYIVGDLLSKFYNEKRERIFPKLNLTKEILAAWYVCDGSLASHPSQKDRANIAICSIKDEESIKNLESSLIEYGFNNFTIYNDGKYFRLRFNHSDALILFKDICNLVPDCVQYKLPEEFRGKYEPIKEKIEIKYYPTKGVITSIEVLDTKIYGTKTYDIETGTHNYITGSCIVHNSNGCILVSKDETVKAFSRNRELSIDSDNNGFCAWVMKYKQYFIDNYHELDTNLWLYGEWIGPGIQKGVGINQLNRKQFVLFSTYSELEGLSYPPYDIPFNSSATSIGLYSIRSSCKNWIIELDVKNPDPKTLNNIDKWTKEVEDQCPWAEMFGIEGFGEGIVWTSYDTDEVHPIRFKTKGEKHQVTKEKIAKEINSELSDKIEKFILATVTESRLNQGINYLEENNLDDTMENVSVFIKWILNDIVVEEENLLTDAELTWNDVKKLLTKEVVTWYKSRPI